MSQKNAKKVTKAKAVEAKEIQPAKETLNVRQMADKVIKDFGADAVLISIMKDGVYSSALLAQSVEVGSTLSYMNQREVQRVIESVIAAKKK